MEQCDDKLMEYLRTLDEKGDNESPLHPEHSSHWCAQKLREEFSSLPEALTAQVEEVGTSDAYFWGDVVIRDHKNHVLVDLVLSKFGNLVLVNYSQEFDFNPCLTKALESALIRCGCVVVPQHIADCKKSSNNPDSWRRRFFDYV